MTPKSCANYEKGFDKSDFEYNVERDEYVCPNGIIFHFSSYKKGKGVKVYRPKQKDCIVCPFRSQCMGKSKSLRAIEVHLHETARREQFKNNGISEYYDAMRLRKIWCEGNFSHQKERHNLRRTRKRGIERVTEQCLLSACALNLKRLVEILFLLQYSAIIPVRKLFGLFFIVKIPVCQQHHFGHPFAESAIRRLRWRGGDSPPHRHDGIFHPTIPNFHFWTSSTVMVVELRIITSRTFYP